jgi:Flp pilus assembly protein TadD
MVEQEGQMLHTMGMLSLGLGNYTAAVEHLSKAKAIAYQLQKKPVLAKMCTNLGIVKMRLGAHEEALALHMVAYDIARELDDLSSQAVCAGNIGLGVVFGVVFPTYLHDLYPFLRREF